MGRRERRQHALARNLPIASTEICHTAKSSSPGRYATTVLFFRNEQGSCTGRRRSIYILVVPDFRTGR